MNHIEIQKSSLASFKMQITKFTAIIFASILAIVNAIPVDITSRWMTIESVKSQPSEAIWNIIWEKKTAK